MTTTDSSSDKGKWIRAKWSLLTAGLCLLSLLAGRYTVRPEIPAKPNGQPAQVADETTADDFETVEPYGPIITRSQGEYTSELIRRASRTLNGYTLRANGTAVT